MWQELPAQGHYWPHFSQICINKPKFHIIAGNNRQKQHQKNRKNRHQLNFIFLSRNSNLNLLLHLDFSPIVLEVECITSIQIASGPFTCHKNIHKSSYPPLAPQTDKEDSLFVTTIRLSSIIRNKLIDFFDVFWYNKYGIISRPIL